MYIFFWKARPKKSKHRTVGESWQLQEDTGGVAWGIRSLSHFKRSAPFLDVKSTYAPRWMVLYITSFRFVFWNQPRQIPSSCVIWFRRSSSIWFSFDMYNLCACGGCERWQTDADRKSERIKAKEEQAIAFELEFLFTTKAAKLCFQVFLQATSFDTHHHHL